MYLSIVKEVSDPNIIYGAIQSELTTNELQREINQIKLEMSDEEAATYSIEDIVDKLNRKGYKTSFEDAHYGVLI